MPAGVAWAEEAKAAEWRPTRDRFRTRTAALAISPTRRTGVSANEDPASNNGPGSGVTVAASPGPVATTIPQASPGAGSAPGVAALSAAEHDLSAAEGHRSGDLRLRRRMLFIVTPRPVIALEYPDYACVTRSSAPRLAVNWARRKSPSRAAQVAGSWSASPSLRATLQPSGPGSSPGRRPHQFRTA